MKMINVAYDTIGNPRKEHIPSVAEIYRGKQVERGLMSLERKYAQEILDQFFNEI